MKILVLNESFNINNHSAAIGRSNLINALVKGGHTVTVLYPNMYDNPEPTWLEDVKILRFNIEGKEWSEKILSLIPKVRVLPAYIVGFNLERMQLIRSWKNAILKALDNNEFDLVYVLGVGNVFAAHFAMSKIDANIPWIANIHDPYPMQHYPEPYKKPRTLLNNKQYRLFDEVLNRASYITYPSQRLMEWMIQFHPRTEDKSFVLPHTEMLLKNLPDAANDEQVILQKGKFNLLHAGSLLGPRNPTYLIKAFMRFIYEDIERKNKSVLNIIGKVTSEHAGFEKEYATVKDNINILVTRVSYKHSLKLLKQADVLILLEAIAKESPFMPGKLADYITSDKPILALTPKTSETSRILGDEYSYITQTDNEDEIYEILVKLWEKWKSGETMHLDRPDLAKYISAENINDVFSRQIIL